jgi:hypothetical protein
MVVRQPIALASVDFVADGGRAALETFQIRPLRRTGPMPVQPTPSATSDTGSGTLNCAFSGSVATLPDVCINADVISKETDMSLPPPRR